MGSKENRSEEGGGLIYMGRAATFSQCGKYRYSLRRQWGLVGRVACFIMLNPSTADAEKDDPTIRRCINFSKSWGFDALEVVNLFGYRTPYTDALQIAPDPVGFGNDEAIINAASKCTQIICAWGAYRPALSRALAVFALLKHFPLYCLGTTKDGRPRHPLYVPGVTTAKLFRGALL